MRLVHVDRFDKGLVTNVDKGDLPMEAATKFQNIRADQPGKIRGVPGYKLFASGPSGIAADLRYFKEVVLEDTQTLIVWGLDGSAIQHFYHSIDGGTTWIEATEIVFFEVNVVTSGTIFTIQAGSSPFDSAPETTDDTIYDRWWAYWHDVSTPANDVFDIITNYVASTKTVTVKYGFTGVANGDKLIFMKSPLWNAADLQDLGDGTIASFDTRRAFVRDEDNFKPTVLQRRNAVSIYTGRKKQSITGGWPNHTNLWLGVIEISSMFVEANPWSGWTTGLLHMERKFLDSPVDTSLIASLASPASSGIGLSAGDYGIKLTLVYDEFQESPIFLEPGGTLAAGQVVTLAGGDDIQVDLQWDRLTTSAEMEFHPGTLRMDAIRIYVCTVDADRRPTSPFFMAKEVKIKGKKTTQGLWTGATIPYVQTVLIDKAAFEASKQFEAELVHGYFSKIRVNADLGTIVNGVEVIASVNAGEIESGSFSIFPGGSGFPIGQEEQKNVLVYTPISLAKTNQSDAPPESKLRNMSENGIYEIFNLKPLRNKLAVFGENRLVVLKGTEESDTFDEVGANWYWSVASKGEKIVWGNTKSIYDLFDGGRPVEIGFPIRNEWQSLSTDNRKKSIAVFHQEDGLFILHSPSGTTYVYDEVQKSWRTYVADKSWEWLDTGVDGELLATDKTNIYQLFPPSGATESITGTYEKVIDFEKPVAVNSFQMMYKITGIITVKIFDLEKGDDYPITQPLTFFSKNEFDAETRRVSFRAKKIMVQLTFSPTAASNHDYEMDWFSMYGHGLTENI